MAEKIEYSKLTLRQMETKADSHYRSGDYDRAQVLYGMADAKANALDPQLLSPSEIRDGKRIHRKYEKAVAQNKKRILEYARKHNPDLASRLTSVITMAGILSGILFLSPNVTGNAIGGLNQTSSNWVGAVFLIIGLVAGFYWKKN